MDIIISYSQLILKFLFFILIPVIAILFRFKKKITTGFLIGLLLTSLFVGILSVASVKKDPVGRFIELINNKKFEQAKSQLQILIQIGPEKVKEIKEKDIAYIGIYKQMKHELRIYYYNIANKFNKKYSFTDIKSCEDLKNHLKKEKYLKHALLLTKFAESIGGNDPVKQKLVNKIEQGKKLKKTFSGKCKDID